MKPMLFEYSTLKKEFEALKQTYLKINPEEQEFSLAKILAKYGNYVINQIEKIIDKEVINESGEIENQESIQGEVKQFLADNAELVNNTLCEYTSIPNYDTTLFLIKCAQFVAQDKTSVLSVLLPKVKYFDRYDLQGEEIDLEKQKVTDVLKQHVLNTTGSYLIPVLDVMQSLEKTINIDEPDDSARLNGFGANSSDPSDKYFSDLDLQKVKNHSEQTKAIVELKKEQYNLQKTDNSLLTALKNLVFHFQQKGVLGSGEEEIAAFGAEAALFRFIDYWNKLPKQKQEKALEIEPLADLLKEFIQANAEKEKQITFKGEVIALIHNNQVIVTNNNYQKSTDGNKIIITENDIPIVTIENASITDKVQDVKLVAKTHVGECFTCINEWQKKLKSIAYNYESSLTSISPDSPDEKIIIKENQDAVKLSIQDLEKSIKNNTYAGGLANGMVSYNLLDACKINFVPQNIDDLLQTFRGISATEMDKIYSVYEENINSVIEKFEDLIVLLINVSPEQFNIILSHVANNQSLNEFLGQSLIRLLDLEYVSTEYKKIVILKININELSVAEFVDVINRVGVFTCSDAEKLQLIKELIGQPINNPSPLISNLVDLINRVSVFTCSDVEKLQLIKNIIELNNSPHFLIDLINRVSVLSSSETDQFQLIKKIIENSITQSSSFSMQTVSEFDDFIILISMAGLPDQDQDQLINFLIQKSINDGFFRNPLEFQAFIQWSENSSLPDKYKHLFVGSLLKKVTDECSTLCQTNHQVIHMAKYINKVTLPEQIKNELINNFIKKVIDRPSEYCLDFNQFKQTIRCIIELALPSIDKSELLLEHLIITSKKNPEEVDYLLHDYDAFLLTIGLIAKANLTDVDKTDLLMKFISKGTDELTFICKNEDEFMMTIEKLEESLKEIPLTEVDKNNLLVAFINKGINEFAPSYKDKVMEFIQCIEETSLDPRDKMTLDEHILSFEASSTSKMIKSLGNSNFLEERQVEENSNKNISSDALASPDDEGEEKIEEIDEEWLEANGNSERSRKLI